MSGVGTSIPMVAGWFVFGIAGGTARADGWSKDSALFVHVAQGLGGSEEYFVVSARSGQRLPDKAAPDMSDDETFVQCAEGDQAQKDGARIEKATTKTAQEHVLSRGSETLYSESFPARGQVSYCWAPDGKRVAFVYEAPFQNMEVGKIGKDEVRIRPAAGPRIELVGKGVSDTRILAIVRALEQAGFTPTGQGEAKSARDKTVVYAQKAHSAVAEKIARAIPGGATVDTLSWKSAFDVVIALATP